MMENILDNLIWDTTTMDEDFIQNGLEGHSHRDQERPRMLSEFENNLKGLLTKDVSCGSKSADLYQIPAEAVIEKGATAVAVISDLFATGDPRARVRAYLDRLSRL